MAYAISETYTQDAEKWFDEGNILFNSGRYEEALTAYYEVVTIDPQNVKAWNNVGITLSKLGRYEEALTVYYEVVTIDPQNVKAWNNVGITLSKLGRYEEALTVYYEAVTIDPQNAKAWNNVGITLSKLGRYDESIIAFNKALEINPEEMKVWVEKFDVLEKLEKQEPIVKPDIYVEPSTGQIINRLILNIQPLLDTSSTGNKSKIIELKYVLEGSNSSRKIFIYNNSYYIAESIKVDLNQNGRFPFEDYNATIFISTNETNDTFFENSTYENMTFDAWGEVRVLSILREDNKIEISMERANKSLSKGLYFLGLIIIISYLLVYIKSPYNPDTLAVFNSFSFLFFVSFVIAGVREYLLNRYGLFFISFILAFFVIFLCKRKASKKHDIYELNDEHKLLKDDLQEMLNQKDEKLTEIIKSLKDDMDKLKPKINRRRR
ncbi:MAG: tetratricopeptide repeat protein [Spirochaetes bacterium]|nr:tetratricopeptide repeat protein [Spirochaetota bacterium]